MSTTTKKRRGRPPGARTSPFLPAAFRAIRRMRGWTQEEIAIELGFASNASVCYWEGGRHRPADKHLVAASKILKVPRAAFGSYAAAARAMNSTTRGIKHEGEK